MTDKPVKTTAKQTKDTKKTTKQHNLQNEQFENPKQNVQNKKLWQISVENRPQTTVQETTKRRYLTSLSLLPVWQKNLVGPWQPLRPTARSELTQGRHHLHPIHHNALSSPWRLRHILFFHGKRKSRKWPSVAQENPLSFWLCDKNGPTNPSQIQCRKDSNPI